MQSCDVLIIGGGPAGSSCARELVRHGRDVVVLDRATFPRDKICAGWITPAVVDELEIDLVDYANGRVLQPITAFRTGLVGGSTVETRYERTVSYGIRRCEFDHYLLARSGAALRLGEALENLRREGEHWIVNDAIRSRLLIGAGGHFCPVARLLAEKLSNGDDEQVVLAQEIEFEMSPDEAAACRVEPEIPELYFCRDLRGYAWCFRKGNFLNVGLGREGECRLSAHVAEFCDAMQKAGRIPRQTHSRFHGHAYRLYRGRPRRSAADGVLLIGDAAGLAYPESGEGIRPAIESGLMAARLVLEADGDFRRTRLDELRQRLADRFGRLRNGPAVRPLFPPSWRRAVGRRLLSTRWFTRHVVIDRWFLHSNLAPMTVDS